MKEKRSTKAKSKQLAQVTIVAKSLVCDASLALDAVGALRLHASNKHIPLIRTLRNWISIRPHLFDVVKLLKCDKRMKSKETCIRNKTQRTMRT